MLDRRVRRKFTVLGVLISTLFVVGIAMAAWTSSGSGNGSATSTTSANSTIAVTGAAAGLYPGASKPMTIAIDNPNAYPVIVTQIAAGTSNAVGSCAANTVTTAAIGDGVNAVVPTGGGGNAISGTTGAPHPTRSYIVTATMLAAATDACKSQTFTIPLTASIQSSA